VQQEKKGFFMKQYWLVYGIFFDSVEDRHARYILANNQEEAIGKSQEFLAELLVRNQADRAKIQYLYEPVELSPELAEISARQT